jgi:L-ascorbate metabolism protein UlaG (beta-lactamase superfamily)
MKFTYYGHSTFSVKFSGKTLLFDPFITPNELAKDIRLEDIAADYILLTHGHFDHVNDAVALAKQTGATVIANFEVATWLGKQGVEKTHPMNIGGGYQFDFGRVKLTTAIHSSTMPDGANGGTAGGFLISGEEGAFYYAGDTALTLDFQLIPEEVSLRFAVLPIGDNFTMGARDAAHASQLLRCQKIIGVHYDTFPWIKIDHAAAVTEFTKVGASLLLPEIGASLEL